MTGIESYFQTKLKQWILFPLIWKTDKYRYPCMLKYENHFVEIVWPANLSLFMYGSTHYIETFQLLQCSISYL